ncbi:MAG: hypothetical protein JXA24_03775 [Proteobacteria bacterium]|nr:hypothetical protein [Pseudomonadota bacterium]
MKLSAIHLALAAALLCAAGPLAAEETASKAGPGAAAPAEDGWQPIISEDGLFSVEMPAVPVFKTSVNEYRIGEIEENSYALELKDSEFVVEYIDLPGFVTIFGRGIIYRMAKRSFLREARLGETGWADIDLGPLGGKELSFEQERRGRPSARSGRARFVLAGRRLYVVAASAEPGSEAAGWVERFLDSFEIHALSSRRRVHKYWEMRQEGTASD